MSKLDHNTVPNIFFLLKAYVFFYPLASCANLLGKNAAFGKSIDVLPECKYTGYFHIRKF